MAFDAVGGAARGEDQGAVRVDGDYGARRSRGWVHPVLTGQPQARRAGPVHDCFLAGGRVGKDMHVVVPGVHYGIGLTRGGLP